MDVLTFPPKLASSMPLAPSGIGVFLKNFPQEKLFQSSQGSADISMVEASCSALILQKSVQHIVPFFSSHGPKEDKFGKYIAKPDIWHYGDPSFVKCLAKHEYS